MSKGGSPRSQLPPGLAPSDFALAHEYYTPTVVAEALADLVCDGIVQAIEPSVGIGRFVRALGPILSCNVSAPRSSGAPRWPLRSARLVARVPARICES